MSIARDEIRIVVLQRIPPIKIDESKSMVNGYGFFLMTVIVIAGFMFLLMTLPV
jgi:hypothetical protein